VVVGLGNSDLSLPNSDLSLNLVARAWLVFDDDDSLAGLGADLGSLGPNIKSLLSVLSSLDSNLTELDIVSSNLNLPFSQVGEGARTWLVSDGDDLAGLSTSADSAVQDVFLSDELLSSDLDLDALNLSLLNSWAIAVRVLNRVQSNLVSVDFGGAGLGLDVEVGLDLELMHDRRLNCMSVSETAVAASAF
jgi:hypothetical protein